VIRIKIFEKGEVLKFHILDNGVGIEKNRLQQIRESLQSAEEQEHHIGMKNTHKRLVLTYPGNEGLTIVSQEGKGTCVRFEVPKEGTHKSFI
ncbi:MAG: sensor histidine kinase, partial [Firmicutes bacterium]|nr:sensor histidine kinase [Bacillota bacterium]